jgi:hypothetical protein
MSLPNFQAYTISQFVQEVKVDIYKRIQSDHEGEMTEDDFNELVCDIKHEELDDAINIMYNDEVERLLCEYGIADAIALVIAEFGPITKDNTVNEKMLLYTIINDNLNDNLINHTDYLDWCENHCDCE